MTELEKQEHMNLAAAAKKPGCCYVHIEMAGGHCERIVGGQRLAILHGLCGVVDKLAEETGLSFGEVLADLKEYRKALGKLNGGDAAGIKQ
jgi:hypothetical protein